MSWTVPLPGAVGQRIKASLYNLAVTAILELQSMPTKFSQTITGATWATTTPQNFTLSSVPTGVAVVGFAMVTLRLGPAYCTIRLFDGATQVGSDLNAVIPSGASGYNGIAIPFPILGTFTNTPVLRFISSSATSCTLDNFNVVGYRFSP